jgi:hypothetical protein
MTGLAMTVNPVTPSSSATTGSLIVGGGLGAAKSIYSGGQLVASIENSVTNAITDLLTLKHR